MTTTGSGTRDAVSRDAGATAAEYALVVSLIAVVVVPAVALIGPALAGVFAAMAAGL